MQKCIGKFKKYYIDNSLLYHQEYARGSPAAILIHFVLGGVFITKDPEIGKFVLIM